jgi:hypothetical protein
MKCYTIRAAIIVAITVNCLLCSCGGGTNPDVNNQPIDSTGRTSDSTEKTVIPVYAIWQPNITSSPYDGLYDSVSHYLRLCQNKQKIHIDDPSQVTIKSEDKCYKQGAAYAMIIIKKDSLAEPVFLTVLHVDSINKNVVAVTDNNDTLATSVKNLNIREFNELNKDYRETRPQQREVEVLKKYYAPERKEENQKKKERAMKIQLR